MSLHSETHELSDSANGDILEEDEEDENEEEEEDLSRNNLSPTSALTTGSMSVSDDMVETENVRDRLSDLEKRVSDQNDEITCLRATLADALRRISILEDGQSEDFKNKGSAKINLEQTSSNVRLRREDPNFRNRRPYSVSYNSETSNKHNSFHSAIDRRASYSSNRETIGHKAAFRRSVLYQSTGSLHSDGHSSNSMSPAPSPSPTNRALSKGMIRHLESGSGIRPSSNLTKKWNSTSDFRDHSSGLLSTPPQRRIQDGNGSLVGLRSPFGSQQNLDRSHRHGTKDATYHSEDGFVTLHISGQGKELFVPTAYLESYSISKVSPAPPLKLKMEWVYGYRGRDARNNLHLLPTGEMIYFVAAVVVLFNDAEKSQRHYLGHTEEVKCLTIHPNKLLIASGQVSGHDRRDGRAHIRIWNSVSLQTLHVLGSGDFERSVICLSFSKADGGNLLAVIDEASDHNLSVWDWTRGSRITETKCSGETVIAAEFHPLEGGVIVTCGKGHVNFWQLDSLSFTLSRKTGLFDVKDKPKYVTCLAFSYTGDVLTGDSNGNVFIWGRGYNAVTKALRKIHDGPVFSICVLKDGSFVTGGGKDRKLLSFDSLYRRSGLEADLPEHFGSIRTICQGKGSRLLCGSTKNSILIGDFETGFQEIVAGHVDDVWTLASHPTQNQFLSAGYDHVITLWDSLSHSSVWSSDVGESAQSACFSGDGDVLVVGMICGKWIVLDSRTREVFGVFQDGTEALQTLVFSPNGKYLALGSGDGIIYMYQVSENYKRYNRMGRCLGHSSSVVHLDWSSDSNYIQSNSLNHEILFWNASVCRVVTNPSSLRDVDWATNSCLLGFNTIGVWPESLDGSTLTSGSRSSNKLLYVTGDDFGKIKLYSYPVSQPKSLYHTGGGHSCLVASLAFLPDNSRLISAGGKDTALLQWVLTSN